MDVALGRRVKSVWFTLLVFVVFVLPRRIAVEASETQLLDSLVAALKARHASMTDLRARYVYRCYVLPNNVGVERGETSTGLQQQLGLLWMKKGSKQYFQKLEEGGAISERNESAWAWNGKELHYIDYDTSSATIASRFFPQDSNIKPNLFFYPADLDYSWAEFAARGELIGVEDGQRGKIYELKVPDYDEDWHYVVRLSEEHGYSPVHVEKYASDHLMTVWDFSALTRTGKGFWYPQKATCWRFGFGQNLRQFDPRKAGNREEYQFQDVQFDSGIPDSQFTLEIPAGMNIYFADLGVFSQDPEVFTPEAFEGVVDNALEHALSEDALLSEREPGTPKEAGDRVRGEVLNLPKAMPDAPLQPAPQPSWMHSVPVAIGALALLLLVVLAVLLLRSRTRGQS